MKIILIALVLAITGCSVKQSIQNYSQDELDYFTEIALGAEFGDEIPVIKKWAKNIRIKIAGEPTKADLQTIDDIVTDLNSIINGIKVKIVNGNENVTITFSPESNFSAIDPNYVPKNYGFFWALWHDDNYVIYEASILVSSEDITQKERSHLIREELIQSLGLMNDSNKYEDSIFYQEWTDISSYSDIDMNVIKMLYNKNIKPGMNKNEVLKILQR